MDTNRSASEPMDSDGTSRSARAGFPQQPARGSANADARPATLSEELELADIRHALSMRDGARRTLGHERSAQIRQRLLDGTYRSDAVIDEVARRIAASGDL